MVRLFCDLLYSELCKLPYILLLQAVKIDIDVPTYMHIDT